MSTLTYEGMFSPEHVRNSVRTLSALLHRWVWTCHFPVCSFSADALAFQYGDVIVTAGAAEQREILQLPAPGVTADCVDNSPAGNAFVLVNYRK